MLQQALRVGTAVRELGGASQRAQQSTQNSSNLTSAYVKHDTGMNLLTTHPVSGLWGNATLMDARIGHHHSGWPSTEVYAGIT